MLSVSVQGADIVERHLKKMANGAQLLDESVRQTAINSFSRVLRTTPKATGNTARLWLNPLRVGEAIWAISNAAKTPDKKHLLVRILDEGRGEVRPVKAKRLYLPISQAAKAKAPGARIPKGLKWGKDYVLVRSVKAYKGTGFLKAEKVFASHELTRNIIAKIRSTRG